MNKYSEELKIARKGVEDSIRDAARKSVDPISTHSVISVAYAVKSPSESASKSAAAYSASYSAVYSSTEIKFQVNMVLRSLKSL